MREDVEEIVDVVPVAGTVEAEGPTVVVVLVDEVKVVKVDVDVRVVVANAALVVVTPGEHDGIEGKNPFRTQS